MKGKVSVNVEISNHKFLLNHGVNVSALTDTFFAEEVKKIKREQFIEENRAGMAEIAAHTEKYGSFSDKHRSW
ncbi:plasmid maintenance protein CcdA [Pantoea sp. Al-1710]|uniref:Plasmid maintenance protein CcdA n=1 Tax=Candidatus Pantoea communis TaxID=2608354 RepID=A0ABX0RNC9_9GAMM|nr:MULTISPECIES: type II toxin-antitoxin system CcdA family antitoxin [Pantoea]NIG12905.1 plasmid maintenance protein CcdA [Pantoea sp. Cy-640]NIG17394.1 plasmid maintenance protein CcdA [Pantoea communis]